MVLTFCCLYYVPSMRYCSGKFVFVAERQVPSNAVEAVELSVEKTKSTGKALKIMSQLPLSECKSFK